MKNKIITILTFIGISIMAEAQNKTLVAYFSHTGENYSVGYINKGNTAIVAEEINKIVKGDLFEIESDRVYSADSYQLCCDQAKEDLNKGLRPKLKKNIDISKYDVIYLGYPIWWGTMPMPVFSFIEANGNLKGKTIIPFCTHEGSSFGNSVDDIKKECPEAKVKNGLSIRGSNAKNSKATVEEFIKKTTK